MELEKFEVTPIYEFQQNVSQRRKLLKKPFVKVVNMTDKELEIDFIYFHTSLINAYRRIILAEVPTMAIEKVHMYYNSSIIQDEVLAHRLGLVPLDANPQLFEFRSDQNKNSTDYGPQDTIKFELNVKCSENKRSNVLSSSLVFEPIEGQENTFPPGSITPLHDDIILAKLNRNQQISLDAFAVKGIGSDHAKFQPGIAWYRFLPEVEIKEPVYDDDAKLVQQCFSDGVIDLEDTMDGRLKAVVKDSRIDSCSRNVFQHDSIKDAVKLTRKSDHIIFYVESQSSLSASDILESSVHIMIRKCDLLLNELNRYCGEDNE